MRLIDADALITMCERSMENAERCLHAQTSDYGHFIVLSTIQTWKYMIEILEEEAPTVDAIPVSFIQQRIDHLQDIADYALDSNGGYIESANSSLYELKMLLSMWKKEQEKQKCPEEA